MAMTDRVFQLSGTCNNYPWGKKGKQSLAAQFCAKTPGTNFRIDSDQFYSELWFGDYPDFPARVLATGEALKAALNRSKEVLLGKKVVEQMDARLPFLPKILSIAKALPLQIHPNKDLAATLHQDDPKKFTDPNHKPEIAVALSKFELFAGFKSLPEIDALLRLPALRPFWPGSGAKLNDTALRDIARTILQAEPLTAKGAQDVLQHTARDELGPQGGYILDLLPRLRDQFGPDDPGPLVALVLMNFLVLEPGDAVYIPADGIHAYLSGDIVECMARSNNVLNTGFCPRADRDNVDLFADSLNLSCQGRTDVLLPSRTSSRGGNGHTVVYQPPIEEFDMLRTELGAGESEEITAADGPGVFIVTSGEGEMHADTKTFELREGFIFYVAPGVSVQWKTVKGMQIHMAIF